MKPLLIAIASPKWLKSLLLGSCVSLLWLPVALAQSTALTRAEVYRLQNIVDLLPNDQQARPAQLDDVMVPRDAMTTGRQSRAELLFNEGSLARIGSQSVFRFIEGMRQYQLPDGSVRAQTILQLRSGIAMVANISNEEVAGAGGGGDDIVALFSIQTTDSLIDLSGSVIVVVNDAGSTIFSLTDGTFVSDLNGGTTLQLVGGERVTIKDGVFGPVESFDLQRLYETSQLTAGLGPNGLEELAIEPVEAQATLRAVRVKTMSAIASQNATLQGLCTLDARGSDSTLSSNCVTSGVDDPLTEFEENREDITPQPDNREPIGNNNPNNGNQISPDNAGAANNSPTRGQTVPQQ
ncbi:MAG: hypothetical protein AAGL08_05755 [Cyanobacteria bacterium J06573_11]